MFRLYRCVLFLFVGVDGRRCCSSMKKVMVALDRSMGDNDDGGEEEDTQRKAKTTSIR